MTVVNERADMTDVLLGLEPEEHPLKYHCRFCLKNTKYLPYTTLFTSAGLNHFLREKIEKCVDVKLLKNDKEIANRICITCSKHLDRAYRFAVRYEDSQKKLQEIILAINEKLAKAKYNRQCYKINGLDYNVNVGDNQINGSSNSAVYSGNNETCLVVVSGNGNDNSGNLVKDEDENSYNESEKGRIYIPSQIRKPLFDSNVYECQICFSVFANKPAMHIHMRKHADVLLNHKELFQSYVDDLCTESDVQEVIAKIVSEADINSGDLDETYFNQCQLCPAVLATKAQLNKHIQQHCESDNANVCQISTTEPKRKNGSNKDMIPNDPLNNLPDFSCGSKTTSGAQTCNICGKSFSSHKRFDTHIKKHFNSQVPPTKRRGKQHRIFQCNDCDKVFNSKVSIRKHVIVHLSKTKKQVYACNVCGKEYVSLVARETHKLKHDPYYEFSCEFCPKKFKLKKLLKEHIRIHTRKTSSQKRSYCCSICDVKFTLMEDLDFHKEMAHKNVEVVDGNLSSETYQVNCSNGPPQEETKDETELIKMEIDEEEYNAQLDDLKEIEEDIMKVEAEDILNMDGFCDDLYLSNEEGHPEIGES